LFFNKDTELNLLRFTVEAWKNLVFNSLQVSHNSRDFCCHKVSSRRTVPGAELEEKLPIQDFDEKEKTVEYDQYQLQLLDRPLDITKMV
jgi:hypothetical protein